MPSTPNLNPPASSAAAHATNCCDPLRRDPPGKHKTMIQNGREQVKCVPERPEARFHGAFDGRRAAEETQKPGKLSGAAAEDGRAVKAVGLARRGRREQEWRRAMAEKFLGQLGDGDAKTVSGEPGEQAEDEERDRGEAAHLARPPAGAAISQRARDRAWCLEALRRGMDPDVVRARLEECRAEDQPNPEDYARRTLERAAASLRHESPAPGIER